MDNFVIDYDNKALQLNFEGESFNFDLNDGDVGDFWHSFTTKDGVLKDINFHQDNENEEPSIGVYGVVEVDGELSVDTNDSIYISECNKFGNPLNYFV
jgi:hypothetical protein